MTLPQQNIPRCAPSMPIPTRIHDTIDKRCQDGQRVGVSYIQPYQDICYLGCKAWKNPCNHFGKDGVLYILIMPFSDENVSFSGNHAQIRSPIVKNWQTNDTWVHKKIEPRKSAVKYAILLFLPFSFFRLCAVLLICDFIDFPMFSYTIIYVSSPPYIFLTCFIGISFGFDAHILRISSVVLNLVTIPCYALLMFIALN